MRKSMKKGGTKTSVGNSSCSNKTTVKSTSTLKTVKEDDEGIRNDLDEDLNSGFSSYLNSSEGKLCY